MGFMKLGKRISIRHILPLLCAASLLACVNSSEDGVEEPGGYSLLEVDLFTASYFYFKKNYPEARLTPKGEALYVRSDESKLLWDADLHAVLIKSATTPKKYEIIVEHSNVIDLGSVDSSDTATYRRDDLAVAVIPGETPEMDDYFFPAHPYTREAIGYEIRTITQVSDFVTKYYAGKGFQVVTPLGSNPWGSGIGKIRIKYWE